MTLGAIFAWVWLPSLQDAAIPSDRSCVPPTIPSKTLERLAEGRVLATSTESRYPAGHRLAGQRNEAQVLSFRGKFNQIRRRFQRSNGFEGRATVEGEGIRSGEGVAMESYPNTRQGDFEGSVGTRSAINGGAHPEYSRYQTHGNDLV